MGITLLGFIFEISYQYIYMDMYVNDWPASSQCLHVGALVYECMAWNEMHGDCVTRNTAVTYNALVWRCLTPPSISRMGHGTSLSTCDICNYSYSPIRLQSNQIAEQPLTRTHDRM